MRESVKAIMRKNKNNSNVIYRDIRGFFCFVIPSENTTVFSRDVERNLFPLNTISWYEILQSRSLSSRAPKGSSE